jgi:exo-1,4-beta-D-glucosaminidase
MTEYFLQQVLRVVAVIAVLATPAAYAANTYAPTPVAAGPGRVVPIANWQIRSSAEAQQSGAEISSAGFSTKGWYPVSGRATVMAGLMENGKYKNVFHDDELRTVARHHFVVPWWYRTQFTLEKGASSRHVLVRTNGIIGGADLWLNGHRIATRPELRGAYPVHEFDVTRWVREGANTLALRVHPADPQLDFSQGWVDWNPQPPDNNMGPWRGVDIVETGPVEMRFPAVTTDLSLPDLARAELTVKVDAVNLDSVPHDAIVSGIAAGVSLQKKIHLETGQTQTVAFRRSPIRHSCWSTRKSGGRSAWAIIPCTT